MLALGLLVAIPAGAAEPPRPDPVAVERALRGGAACLERDFDGEAFRDPYLTFVYPAEKLPSPPGRPPLTYRMLDADTILVLLGRERAAPPGMEKMIAGAGRAIHEAAPLFEKAGLSNVRKGARADGVALDTYCIAGWLEGSEAMAREVARALDGDGWLLDGLYDGEERFRSNADECWCLRLLVSQRVDPSSWRPALDRISKSVLDHAERSPSDRGAFYDLWHLGMVLREIDTHHPKIPALVAALHRWAAAHRAPDGASSPDDLFEWVNLASSDLLRGKAGVELRDEAASITLKAQDAGGCWRVPGEASGSGTTFLTLRAMLAIAPYRPEAIRGPAPGPEPAP